MVVGPGVAEVQMRCIDRLRPLAFLALAVGAAWPLPAQLAEVQPGVKVRIRAPSAVGGQVQGFVATRSRDSLSLSTGQGPLVSLPLAAITSVEVSRGKSRTDGAKRGLLWGVPIGVLVMMADAPTDESRCTSEPCTDDLSDAQRLAIGVIGGGGGGAGIGALVGRERWQRLEVTPRLSVGVPRQRFTIGAAVAF